MRPTANFAGTKKTVAASRSEKISDRHGDALFNALFQALGRATNVPTIAVEHKLVDNVAAMMKGSTSLVVGKSCRVLRTIRDSTAK